MFVSPVPGTQSHRPNQRAKAFPSPHQLQALALGKEQQWFTKFVNVNRLWYAALRTSPSLAYVRIATRKQTWHGIKGGKTMIKKCKKGWSYPRLNRCWRGLLHLWGQGQLWCHKSMENSRLSRRIALCTCLKSTSTEMYTTSRYFTCIAHPPTITETCKRTPTCCAMLWEEWVWVVRVEQWEGCRPSHLAPSEGPFTAVDSAGKRIQ